MISERNIIQKTSKHLATSVDDEVVILGIESGNYFGFNRIASDIWQMLDHPVAVNDLISELESRYASEDNAIRNDVIPFLDTLKAKGLIEVHHEDHA